jgi:hypothetical protein
VAGVVCVILIAVPLYLLRRPSSSNAAAVVASASASALRSAPAPIAVDAGAPPSAKPAQRVTLAPAQRVKCGASATQARVEGGLCDSMPPVEQALATAIRSCVDAAPKRKKEEGSINFVLNIDFRARKFHVFPGASGSWRGPLARKATDCVNRAFPNPDWGALPHQYAYYWVAILATYPLPGVAPPGTPTFE